MAKQFRDIVFGKDSKDAAGQKKTFWVRVGRLVHDSETGNISIFLDAYPANGENLMAFKPRPQDAKPAAPAPAPAPEQSEIKVEDIPF